MKKYLLLLPFLACVTTPSSTSSQRAALSAGDSLTCTATTQCTCLVSTTSPVDGGPPSVDSGVVAPDSGSPAAPDSGVPGPTDAGVSGTWSLSTTGNRILLPNGQPAKLRGMNLFDTRMCGACTNENWAEVRRKFDVAIQEWGANFIRLNLEEAAASNQAYFTGLGQLITGLRQRYPDVYVMVSPWNDSLALTSVPDGNPNGAPNGAPHTGLMNMLTVTLRDEPNVLIACSNEPRGQPDTTVWAAMKNCVDTIRGMEDPTKRHIVVVQGTQQWGRTLNYYVGKELGAGVAYETHIYDPQSAFAGLLQPAQSLPTIIGEFGTGSFMTAADTEALIKLAESRNIAWTAWSFTRSCPPDMLVSTVSRCSASTLTPSAYGQAIKDRLAKPWGSQ